MKQLLSLLALVIFASPALAFDSLEALTTDFHKKEAEAIKAYLQANPEAEDRDEAESRLSYDLMASGQDDEAIALLRKKYDALRAGPDKDEVQMVFGQAVAPLASLYERTGKREEGKAFLAQVSADFADHPMAEELGSALKGMASAYNQPAVGDTMEIAFTALDGTEIDLAKMTDKVVLVDFWATWCGPCVKELPHVKAAYDKYHDKGFEILGISLDDDKDKLDSFIKDRGLTWPMFYDGNGWETELVTKYGISGIPATFLVGKDGKIAATNLRGKALETKLAELLGAAE